MAMPISLSKSVRKVWTISDLERLPNDGNRYEILHGELLVTPMPSTGHQRVTARLFVNLANWCRAHTGWTFLSPGGVYMSQTTWLEPDAAIYATPDYGDAEWRDMPPPVLVVETQSKSTARRDRFRKRPAYLAHGVQEVWIVIEKSRMVERWTGASEFPSVFGDVISWQPDVTKPEFSMTSLELFGPVK
ncbi:MAG: Uma2 family endonuclease [Gemmatimonas sp.]